MAVTADDDAAEIVDLRLLLVPETIANTPIHIGEKQQRNLQDETENLDLIDEDDLRRSSMPAVVTAAEAKSPVKERISLAVVALLLYCSCSVADQQLLKNVFSDDFNAPFFILYVNNVLRISALPLYICTVYFSNLIRRKAKPVRQILKACSIYESDDPLPIFFIKSIGIIGSIIILAITLNIMALSYASASECATTSTTQVAMVYFVAVIFLNHKALLAKVLAVAVSLTGVALIAYSKGFRSSAAIGIGLTLISTVLFSFNITYFKHLYKCLTFGQCCTFMSSTASFTVIFFWCLPLSMKLTDGEVWEWNTVPWGWLMSSALCSYVAGTAINYGLSLASPLVMSFGSLLRIPCNILIDFFMRNMEFSHFEIIGSVLIILGFIVIVIPDKKLSVQIKSRLSKCCS